jgi:hypothetical protein
MIRTWRRFAAIAAGSALVMLALWSTGPAAPAGGVEVAITFCPWTGTPLPVDPCSPGPATPAASPGLAGSPQTATASPAP